MGSGVGARQGCWPADYIGVCCGCCTHPLLHLPSLLPPDLPATPCLCCCSCWAGRAQPTPKHIVYGATDLLAGEQFLQQLSTLGHKSGAAPVQTY